MVPCAICAGTGFVRSTESTALHVLRAIEEEGIRGRAETITVKVPLAVALYVLNNKRAALREIERRYQMHVMVFDDADLVPPEYAIEIDEARSEPKAVEAEEEIEPEAEDADTDKDLEAAEDGKKGRRRRRRRKRPEEDEKTAPSPAVEAEEAFGEETEEERKETVEDADEDGSRRRRRRGRRGGRRRRAAAETVEVEIADSEEPLAAVGEAVPEAEEASAEPEAESELPTIEDQPAPVAEVPPPDAEVVPEPLAAESGRAPEAPREDEAEQMTPALQAPAADGADSYSAGGDAPPVQVHNVGTEQKEEVEEAPKRRGWWQRKIS